MHNLDTLKEKKLQLATALGDAMNSEDEEIQVQAIAAFAEHIQESVMAEAKGLISAADTSILAGRGVQQLTSKEVEYYNKVIDAIKSGNPKMELQNLDVVMPETVIERVFDDLTVAHPLLQAISITNTTAITEWIYHAHETQLAQWGELDAEIVKEITSGFRRIDMKMFKLSAFFVISNAMLDLGPQWLDRYIRVMLAEAIALAVEEAIVNGNGKTEPIGMNKSLIGAVDGVHNLRNAVKLDSFDPVNYGTFIADNLATTENGNPRVIPQLLMVCNPQDYLRKIMPATTIRTPDGNYVNDVLPFPTLIVQSTRVTSGRSVIGIAERYFMGIGAGTDGGRLEHSDEYRFLEHQRVYRIFLYGNGRPMDNVSFAWVDISDLQPLIQQVQVVGTMPEV